MSIFNPANTQAQCDCADFAGNLETPLPDIVPFCGGFNLTVSVANIDENECSGAPMIRVWIGTDNKGPNYPALQSVNYLGNLPLLHADFIGISPPQASLLDLQYRRFYFNLDTLQYLDSIEHTLMFSFDPETYSLADFYTIVVEVLNQDTITCGTYAYASNTFIDDVDVHELLTEPPVGGLVSELIADTILFNNNIVEALTIRGGLDVDVSYTFDGPGGLWGRPQLYLRACSDFGFEASMSKFCFKEGKICSCSRVPTAKILTHFKIKFAVRSPKPEIRTSS